MSYQVLARKWRPRTFAEMAGQEHVLKALINALDNDRLHHAYLFTGTRGVGKTTIARILAKCLNCEEGVSSTPCGKCSACADIADGRFIDLIEVDAASRTKVEDTRELLDNVQYMPSHGRFKVYLIDEVHMLSGHSFNALLKTLEEPPAHVKFLLATTDPQKLPVTILSRCLQFNLKNLSPERIVEHLQFVLGEEKVPYEEAALWALGRAADGSMRDALSLTDQAIAHGGGKLSETELSTMLGSIDRSWIIAICQALAERDSAQVLAQVALLAEHAPDFATALSEMLSVWHRVAIAQVVPEAADNSLGDQQMITTLASSLGREEVQLYYQICLLGKRDLSLASDPRSGFEMVMLRLLAFQPAPEVAIKPAPSAEGGDASAQVGRPQSPASTNAPEASAKPETSSQSDPVSDTNAALGQAQPHAVSAVVPAANNSAELSPARQVGEAEKKSEGLDVASQVQPSSPALEPLTDIVCEPSERLEPHSAMTSAADLEPQSKVTTVHNEAFQTSGEEERSENPAPHFTRSTIGAVHAPVTSRVEDLIAATGATPIVRQPVEAKPADLAAVDNCQTVLAQVGDYPLSSLDNARWLVLCNALPISGLLATVAANSVLTENTGQRLLFCLEKGHDAVYDPAYQQRLADVLSEHFKQPMQVEITIGQVSLETPYLYRLRKRAERQALAVQTLCDDPVAKALEARFGATLDEASVLPID
ncbi:MAG: DNA polymerase III subunit gamma/tau [Porticoccaceae bacterium]|nr:DNA polymerase III subunit gamma/tau [Porticoccaceae bacterium]